MKQQPVIDETKYGGQWLALDPKTYKVVAHNKSLQESKKAAKRRGIDDPLMHGVPESDGYFIGSGILN